MTALVAAEHFVIPHQAQKAFIASLNTQGIKAPVISSTDKQGSQITFSDINLDEEGFSKINTVTVDIKRSSIFSENDFLSQIAIDGLNIAGEISPDGILSLAGWNPFLINLEKANFKDVKLDNAILDLYTKFGALRLLGKGQIQISDQGQKTLDFILTGKQHQLNLNSIWKITSIDPRKTNIDIEIKEARINVENFKASRISGWTSLQKEKNDFPVISGQFYAGQMQVGDNSGLENIKITINGSAKQNQIIFSSESAQYKDVRLTVDIYNDQNGSQMGASVEAKKLSHLLGFLIGLNKDLNFFNISQIDLTNLLITPGNIKRVHNKIQKLHYDELELVINGDSYDLTGKILVKENGVARHVISLNPG